MIIINARKKHLFEDWASKQSSLDGMLPAAQEAWTFYVKKQFGKYDVSVAEHWETFVQKYESGGLPEAAENEKFSLYLKTAVSSIHLVGG